MKWWTPIISALLVAACAWTPERANPYDPGSDRYVDPPQANRAPVIRSLVVNTNCVNFPTEDQCGVLITAQIDDADNNLDLTRVQATITWPDSLPLPFGTLLYFPIDTAWKLEKLETELLYPAGAICWQFDHCDGGRRFRSDCAGHRSLSPSVP
ncbi:MAG: hypothetical protein IPK53_14145 [bacterium]|nr:hypothetical protein [bacterium]